MTGKPEVSRWYSRFFIVECREGFRKLLLDSEDFCWLIGVFFAALIALHMKRTTHGHSLESVRLSQGNLVSEH